MRRNYDLRLLAHLLPYLLAHFLTSLLTQAQEYELLQAMNNTLDGDKMGSYDGNKGFISTIVIEKNANQLKNITTEKIIEVRDVATISDTKKSVLVDRTLESTKKKLLLDQLSGDTAGSASKITTFGDQLLTSYTKIAQDEKLDYDKDLNTTYVSERISMIINKLNVSANNDAGMKSENTVDALYSKEDDLKYLPTVDEIYSKLKPWWFRMIIKGLAPNLLSSNSGDYMDEKILELALLLEIKNATETIESLSVNNAESPSTSSSYDNESLLETIYNDLSNVEAKMLARYNRIVISSGLSDKFSPIIAEYVDVNDEDGISLPQDTKDDTITADEASDALDEIEILLGKILSRAEDIKLNSPGVTDISEADKELFVYGLKRVTAIMPYLDNTTKNSNFNTKMKDIMETVEYIWLFCDANSESDISARVIKSLDPSSAISPSTAVDLFNSMNVSSIVKSNMNFLNNNERQLATEEEANINSSAERLIVDYFDPTSRRNGLALSKEGAGRFQSEILKELFTVTAVIKSQGAIIFEGNSNIKDTSILASKIEEKYLSSDLSKELKYTIIMNEKYPSLEGGIQQAALESILGSTPAVVVFPSSWNTNIDMSKGQGAGKVWANLLTSASILLSGLFAAGCFNLFQNGEFAANGVPDDFLPLAIVPLAIPTFSNSVEKIIAKMKGIDMTSLLIPTMSVFTFGSRSTYLNMPKSRNDIFDTTFSGVMVSLVASIVALVTGIYFTSIAPNEVLQSYPTVSLSLLTTNKIIEELLLYNFPTLVSDTGIENGVDTLIHMHWLAIAGGLSFIASTLQLIPLDNSSGSKMTYAVLGRENFFLFSIISALLKLAYIIPTLFNFSTALNGIKMLRTRLFLDYVISSQICSSAGENQIAVDNITDITETRKIAYFFLIFLLLFSYFPYVDIINDITGIFNRLSEMTSALPLI